MMSIATKSMMIGMLGGAPGAGGVGGTIITEEGGNCNRGSGWVKSFRKWAGLVCIDDNDVLIFS